MNLIWRAIILNDPPNASHFLVVGSWYTICSWSPLAGWLLQCLLENFWVSLWLICSCSAGFLYDTYICMPSTVGTRSVIVNSNWYVQLWEFYIGKKNYRQIKSFSATGSILDMERTCRRPLLTEEKWTEFVVNGHIPQENFGTTCTGVGASFPQNVTKVLDFHLHRTTVIHKVYNATCEARLNFMN